MASLPLIKGKHAQDGHSGKRKGAHRLPSFKSNVQNELGKLISVPYARECSDGECLNEHIRQ